MRWLRVITIVIVAGAGIGLSQPTQAQTSSTCAYTAAQAQAVLPSGALSFTPEVTIPTFSGEGSVVVTGTTIAKYIEAIFVYFIWTVGILATFMVVYGGIKWVAAAGNPSLINEARTVINNAIIGIIIALTSVLLLNTINPDLANFKGLTIKKVDSCLVTFLSDVISSAGAVTECSATFAGGEPSQACTTSTCTAGYNDWINAAALRFGVDPTLIKAVIEVETYSNPQGYPMSQASLVPARPGSTLLSSSYGLSQQIATTLFSQIKKINGGLPAQCNENDPYENDGSLDKACAAWLDADLKFQVELVASYLQDMSRGRCVNARKSPTFIAAAYHLGPGGVEDFCSGNSLKDTTMQAATDYVKKFNFEYQKICRASAVVF